MQLRKGLQRLLGMPAQAQGGVDEDGTGSLQRRGQERDDALGHHRDMDGCGHERPLITVDRPTRTPAARPLAATRTATDRRVAMTVREGEPEVVGRTMAIGFPFSFSAFDAVDAFDAVMAGVDVRWISRLGVPWDRVPARRGLASGK